MRKRNAAIFWGDAMSELALAIARQYSLNKVNSRLKFRTPFSEAKESLNEKDDESLRGVPENETFPSSHLIFSLFSFSLFSPSSFFFISLHCLHTKHSFFQFALCLDIWIVLCYWL